MAAVTVRLSDALQQLGINDKRGNFYLAALETGEAPVPTVAKRAGVSRTIAYSIVDWLVKAGLVTRLRRQGKYYVVAADPNHLLRVLADRQRTLGDVLPELQSLYSSSIVKPRIRFHEGREGIRTVLYDTLTCRSKHLSAVLSMADLRELPGEQEQYIAERRARGIHLRVVRSPAKEEGDHLWPTSARDLRELRYAPADLLFTMTTWIYDHKVALISSRRENFGMIIESLEFSQLMTNFFELLWRTSTRVGPVEGSGKHGT